MHVTPTPLPGVFLLHAAAARDDRGSFGRLSCVSTLAEHGIDFAPRQTSLSGSTCRLTLRGLHFQIEPSAETKIVHCLAGAIFDVVVDLRPDSPKFRRAFTTELTAGNGLGVLVPPGCAHGLLTLTSDTAILYQIDRDHAPDLASGVRWNDPAFAIEWPAAPAVISSRDSSWPDFARP